jgi:hypothetical protein
LFLFQKEEEGYVKVSKKREIIFWRFPACDVPEDLGVAGRGAGCAPPLEC